MQPSTKTELARKKIRVEMLNGKQCIGSFLQNDNQQLVFGSSESADVILPETKAASIHALLRINNENNVVLYDLGSELGTFIAGKKIIQSTLDAGTRFRIGTQEFKIDFLDNDPHSSPEYNLFWSIRRKSNSILDIALIREGKLNEVYHLSENEKLKTGFEDNQILIENIPNNESFVERKKNKGAFCYLPEGFTAEIYDLSNTPIGAIEKSGEYFCISGEQKARLIKKDQKEEIQIYWRPREERLDRLTPDPENKPFKKSISASLGLSLLVIGLLHFIPKKEMEENLGEKKSSYYRVTQAEPTQAAAPAPVAQSLETVNQVVEKQVTPTHASKKPTPQEKPVNQPPQQVPNKNVVALQNTLSNLLNRSLNKNITISDRGKKVMEAAIVPASGSSNLKTEIGAQVSGGSVNTNQLSQALKQGNTAAGLSGFQGSNGAGIGNILGNGVPNMNVGLGDSDAETSGGLDKSVIAAIVREHLGQIKHCYERQLLVDPNLFGKIVANWTINSTGIVDATSVKKSTMSNEAVENCVMGKIKTWKFPQPRGGGKVVVSYPFLFKSVN